MLKKVGYIFSDTVEEDLWNDNVLKIFIKKELDVIYF